MLPALRIKKGKERQVLKGFPWVYLSDVIQTSDLLHVPAGAVVTINNSKDVYIATGYFNPKSQIACRILSRNEKEKIDEDFFIKKINEALKKRDKYVKEPYHRLIHAEADGVPGLIADRFGDTLVCQFSTAGIEKLQDVILSAFEKTISPKTIILRNDFSTRTKEGLTIEVRVIKGEYKPYTEVHENGCIYLADLMLGQKTGWFYDQRDNRKIMADLSEGKTVLDVYSHSGGFGIACAIKGAKKVTMVDASSLALKLAADAAKINKISDVCDYIEGDAFKVMEALFQQGKKYDVVVADPPAFVKSKKDFVSGMKGYEKVAKYSAGLVEKGGYLYVASCSHHAMKSHFIKAVEEGVERAGRKGKIIQVTGAAKDHPSHHMLPQSEYLKAVIIQLD